MGFHSQLLSRLEPGFDPIIAVIAIMSLVLIGVTFVL